MQDEIKQNTDKDTYQNPFTPSKNQRKKLTLPISELIELDNTNQFKITFCFQLAKYICNTNKLSELREVLKAVAEYEIVRDKDLFLTKSAGFFDYKDKQIFFKERSGDILIGFRIESEIIPRFAEYKYYSLQAVVEAVKDF